MVWNGKKGRQSFKCKRTTLSFYALQQCMQQVYIVGWEVS